MTTSARSPGDRVLTTAASMAPEPEPVRRRTSPLVPISSTRPADVSRSSSGELGAAVVDHLLRLRVADGGRDRRRPGRPEVLFHGQAS